MKFFIMDFDDYGYKHMIKFIIKYGVRKELSFMENVKVCELLTGLV